jgi:hypothetical protein
VVEDAAPDNAFTPLYVAAGILAGMAAVWVVGTDAFKK